MMAKDIFYKILLVILLNGLVFPCIINADGIKKNRLKGEDWAYSGKVEFSALPAYCKARFYPSESDIYKKWQRKIGQDFIHFHHYCRGCTLLRRGMIEFDIKKRAAILGSAIKEIDYTLTHSSSRLNSKLRASMINTKVQALELMGKSRDAFIERQKRDFLLRKKGKKTRQ